jgi:DNA-binding NtrC family response regulator
MEADKRPPPYPEQPILVIDGDEALRSRIELLFARAGIDNVVATADSGLAASLVAERRVGLVLLDLELRSASGKSLLHELSLSAPEVPIVVMTADSGTQTVVACMREGASDYVVKPVDETRLFVSVWNSLASLELKREAEHFRERVLTGRLEKPEAFAAIVTGDERMLGLFKYVESIARSRQSVLITGETGTGKELFARAVHQASGRAGPFVAVNVGGLDDTMFSDSLFGHRKGAFTGAEGQRAGLLKEAAGGTILLDEIGDLEQHSQIKLLRLLQEGEYYPLGSDSPMRSDARVVAATTKDLRAATATGNFRSDLFFRLQTHPIAIPPLRERSGDLLPLVSRFLEKSAADLGMDLEDRERVSSCAEAIVGALAGYAFPGNVRELESLVHDAVAARADGTIDTAALRERIGLGLSAEAVSESVAATKPSREAIALDELPKLARELAEGRIPTMAEAEQELMSMAVEAASGNLSQAAAILGISRQTLYNKHKGRTSTQKA